MLRESVVLYESFFGTKAGLFGSLFFLKRAFLNRAF